MLELILIVILVLNVIWMLEMFQLRHRIGTLEGSDVYTRTKLRELERKIELINDRETR